MLAKPALHPQKQFNPHPNPAPAPSPTHLQGPPTHSPGPAFQRPKASHSLNPEALIWSPCPISHQRDPWSELG